MVGLYVDGQRVGTPADAERLIPDLIGRSKTVELRDDASGRRIGTVFPEGEPLVPWDPTITREELDRRAAAPGLTFEEVKQRLGWR